jgi:hypothetical protein
VAARVQTDDHHVQANLPAAKTTTHTIRNRNIETAKLACFLNSLKTFVDPRRSSEKDRAHEEENRDRGSEEGYDSRIERRAGMGFSGTPAKAASMTSRDGYIWFAVGLAVAIVVLACIAIWT